MSRQGIKRRPTSYDRSGLTLTPTQAEVLRAVRDEAETTTAITARCGLEPAAVRDRLMALKTKGLVERERNGIGAGNHATWRRA